MLVFVLVTSGVKIPFTFFKTEILLCNMFVLMCVYVIHACFQEKASFIRTENVCYLLVLLFLSDPSSPISFFSVSSSFFFLSSFICLPRVLGSCPKCHPQHDLFSV